MLINDRYPINDDPAHFCFYTIVVQFGFLVDERVHKKIKQQKAKNEDG
jgi:hypothetical protein